MYSFYVCHSNPNIRSRVANTECLCQRCFLEEQKNREEALLRSRELYLKLQQQKNREEALLRSRELYLKLQDLVNIQHVTLTKEYYFDSDPDEMERELEMQKDNIEKRNFIRLCRSIFSNCVFLFRCLNDRYDFVRVDSAKLADFFTCDMEYYDDLFGQLYEKYKVMPKRELEPEEKLIYSVMIKYLTFYLLNRH